MRRLLVLVLVPLLFVGAACGGDDDDDAAGGGGGANSFCDKARDVDSRFNELESSFSGDEIPSKEVFDQAADTLEDLAGDAPGEVKDDLQTIVDGVRQIADVFGKVDLSDPSALTDPANADALQEMGEKMESIGTDVEDASDRVETYLKDECNIDISGDDDGSTGSSTEDGS
jgi:hypothetical protein